ncbi:MAG TPA: carboxypeptidase regulatory-like domain-containing protein [Blastocatellia bacterium]|nr:carboxypeptidase regulatory-like domain-containing protein [Blastocatellia bacterium]HMY73189.1 carboxypeptidase regulatory-like domain-containing protein [Blastocatellia bacterium]HMZ21124.1 carboxypeptidase regulatory-like domain-containing protein [Blastocatellia bacterium]HNG28936.1 carboxypeptidase regulatory-like domain-containing protein [Blastocatellia bacterium]
MHLSPFVRAVTLCVLLIATVQAAAQVRPPDNRPRNSSISGRVTVGGNPLQNKIVLVTEIPERNRQEVGDVSFSFGGSSAASYSVRTDADGRYRIIGLPAGKYEVHPQAGAYVPEKKSGEREQTVTLDDGEAKENVNFALVRGGVITGRVTDAEGHPLIGRQVEVRPVKEPQSPAEGGFFSEGAETDDRGIYRAYGIRAGRYVVSTSGGRGFQAAQPPSKYPKTYYHNTTEEAQARVIEVTEGGEVTNVDIQLGAARKGFEAAGRVIDSETGQPLPQVSLMCFAVGSKDGVMTGFSGTAKSDEKGEFHFNGLQPGQYSIQMTPMFAGLTGAPSEHYAEALTFEVTAGDVGGLELRAKRGASLSGVAVLEAAPDQKGASKLGQLMLAASVMPTGENPGEQSVASTMSGMSMAKLNADGSFRITGLSPGKALLRPFGIGGATPVVKRMERNGVEMREGIEIKAGEAVTGVKIVLAYANGAIRGQVNITGGQLPAGMRILATAMNANAAPTEQGESAEVDGKGRFLIEGLLDGDYEVSAQVLSDQEGFNQIAPARQIVRVANGAEGQVTLTLDLSKKREAR